MHLKWSQAYFLASELIGRSRLLSLMSLASKHNITLEELANTSPDHYPESSLSEAQKNAVKSLQERYSLKDYQHHLKEKKIEVIDQESPYYPALLQEIDDKPVVLFTKGKLFIENEIKIGVVGTRRVTEYGRACTKQITSELVGLGAQIMSGFMYGVDFIAHQTALDFQGKTVGFLGYGFDHIYPVSQKRFFKEFLERGMVFMTELAPHVPPKKGHFPLRNRLIAGSSQAVVVVEAAEKSGSHITAQAALEYDRAVTAVMGPITNPYSEGTKNLINNGAVLVSSGLDIIEAIGNSATVAFDRSPINLDNLDEIEQKIVEVLRSSPISTDNLGEILKIEISQLNAKLTGLELKGLIIKTGEMWQATL